MAGRKALNEQDARRCLTAVKASGRELGDWAREHGVDAHNLKPEECAHCGSTALDVADVVEEEKLDVVKEHQRRRVVKRTTCRCRDCGGRTTPRSLPAPYERSKVTCDWLAWLVMTKFSMLRRPVDFRVPQRS